MMMTEIIDIFGRFKQHFHILFFSTLNVLLVFGFVT